MALSKYRSSWAKLNGCACTIHERIFPLHIFMHRLVNATCMQLEVGSVHAMIVQTITNLDLNDFCEMPTTFFYKGKMAKLL